MNIEFVYREKAYRLDNESRYKNWLIDVACKEDKSIEELRYIFVNEKNITELNKKYLGHYYKTDIITFDDNFLNTIKGEIYICVPIVKNNSINYSKGNFVHEMNRVLVHGLLHLIGYDDKSDAEKLNMRKKEDYYMQYLK